MSPGGYRGLYPRRARHAVTAPAQPGAAVALALCPRRPSEQPRRVTAKSRRSQPRRAVLLPYPVSSQNWVLPPHNTVLTGR